MNRIGIDPVSEDPDAIELEEREAELVYQQEREDREFEKVPLAYPDAIRVRHRNRTRDAA